jgi:dTDP-4-dehydrorhamnose 3,5-epimerase
MTEWILQGIKDSQSVTPEWRSVHEGNIEGAVVHEMAHVPTDNGYLTELLRPEWLPDDDRAIRHVYQRTYQSGTVSAWHAHANTTDRLVCIAGRMLVVLYDGRKGSPTEGQVAKHRVGVVRPMLIIVPPGVWHGVKSIGPEPAMMINMSDSAYRYTDPDHWRVPQDSPLIPFQF